MPTPPMTDAYKAALLAARMMVEGNTEAAQALSKSLGRRPNTIRNHIIEMVGRDATPETISGLLGDLTKPALRAEMSAKELAALRSAQDRQSALGKQNRELADQVAQLSEWRNTVFGISEEPLRPKPIERLHRGDGNLTFLSGRFDFHRGKVVRPQDVHGLQHYNPDICSARVRRASQISVREMKATGAKADAIVLVYGGDNVNGELREDDIRNNIENPVEQVLGFCEDAIADIEHHAEAFRGVPIQAVFLYGNHSRLSKKPPMDSPHYNWEYLLGSMVERHFKNEDQVHVIVAKEPDVIMPVYDKSVLLTHGDRIGSNGGDGQIGSIGPTKRGSLKMETQIEEVRRYVQGTRPVILTWMGHWHNFWTDWRVLVSASGIGPESYGEFRRYRPSPARQDLVLIHAERGVVDIRPIWPGSPDEGPLYGGDPETLFQEIERGVR